MEQPARKACAAAVASDGPSDWERCGRPGVEFTDNAHGSFYLCAEHWDQFKSGGVMCLGEDR